MAEQSIFNMLFKNSLGVANTLDTKKYFEEALLAQPHLPPSSINIWQNEVPGSGKKYGTYGPQIIGGNPYFPQGAKRTNPGEYVSTVGKGGTAENPSSVIDPIDVTVSEQATGIFARNGLSGGGNHYPRICFESPSGALSGKVDTSSQWADSSGILSTINWMYSQNSSITTNYFGCDEMASYPPGKPFGQYTVYTGPLLATEKDAGCIAQLLTQEPINLAPYNKYALGTEEYKIYNYTEGHTGRTSASKFGGWCDIKQSDTPIHVAENYQDTVAHSATLLHNSTTYSEATLDDLLDTLHDNLFTKPQQTGDYVGYGDPISTQKIAIIWLELPPIKAKQKAANKDYPGHAWSSTEPWKYSAGGFYFIGTDIYWVSDNFAYCTDHTGVHAPNCIVFKTAPQDNTTLLSTPNQAPTPITDADYPYNSWQVQTTPISTITNPSGTPTTSNSSGADEGYSYNTVFAPFPAERCGACVQFVWNLMLSPIDGTNNESYYHPLLINNILPNYSSQGYYSYYLWVYQPPTGGSAGSPGNTGTWTLIPGTSNIIVNPASGVLKFATSADVPTGVDQDHPPIISFFRYGGQVWDGTVDNLQGSSTSTGGGGTSSVGLSGWCPSIQIQSTDTQPTAISKLDNILCRLVPTPRYITDITVNLNSEIITYAANRCVGAFSNPSDPSNVLDTSVGNILSANVITNTQYILPSGGLAQLIATTNADWGNSTPSAPKKTTHASIWSNPTEYFSVSSSSSLKLYYVIYNYKSDALEVKWNKQTLPHSTYQVTQNPLGPPLACTDSVQGAGVCPVLKPPIFDTGMENLVITQSGDYSDFVSNDPLASASTKSEFDKFDDVFIGIQGETSQPTVSDPVTQFGSDVQPSANTDYCIYLEETAASSSTKDSKYPLDGSSTGAGVFNPITDLTGDPSKDIIYSVDHLTQPSNMKNIFGGSVLNNGYNGGEYNNITVVYTGTHLTSHPSSFAVDNSFTQDQVTVNVSGIPIYVPWQNKYGDNFYPREYYNSMNIEVAPKNCIGYFFNQNHVASISIHPASSSKDWDSSTPCVSTPNALPRMGDRTAFMGGHSSNPLSLPFKSMMQGSTEINSGIAGFLGINPPPEWSLTYKFNAISNGAWNDDYRGYSEAIQILDNACQYEEVKVKVSTFNAYGQNNNEHLLGVTSKSSPSTDHSVVQPVGQRGNLPITPVAPLTIISSSSTWTPSSTFTINSTSQYNLTAINTSFSNLGYSYLTSQDLHLNTVNIVLTINSSGTVTSAEVTSGGPNFMVGLELDIDDAGKTATLKVNEVSTPTHIQESDPFNPLGGPTMDKLRIDTVSLAKYYTGPATKTDPATPGVWVPQRELWDGEIHTSVNPYAYDFVTSSGTLSGSNHGQPTLTFPHTPAYTNLIKYDTKETNRYTLSKMVSLGRLRSSVNNAYKSALQNCHQYTSRFVNYPQCINSGITSLDWQNIGYYPNPYGGSLGAAGSGGGTDALAAGAVCTDIKTNNYKYNGGYAPLQPINNNASTTLKSGTIDLYQVYSMEAMFINGYYTSLSNTDFSTFSPGLSYSNYSTGYDTSHLSINTSAVSACPGTAGEGYRFVLFQPARITSTNSVYLHIIGKNIPDWADENPNDTNLRIDLCVWDPDSAGATDPDLATFAGNWQIIRWVNANRDISYPGNPAGQPGSVSASGPSPSAPEGEYCCDSSSSTTSSTPGDPKATASPGTISVRRISFGTTTVTGNVFVRLGFKNNPAHRYPDPNTIMVEAVALSKTGNTSSGIAGTDWW